MIDAGSISTVLDALRPERAALLATLEGLESEDWARPTECPAYSVQGIATHLLGDDFSLLSRQRDEAEPGLIALAAELPGVDFRTLLDTFNDRWVAAAGFFSPALLIELLRLTGAWTADYYESVDPEAPGEPVGLFGSQGQPSPFWHSIAREYLERWVHQSQILRALGRPSLADEPFLSVGLAVVAAVARVDVETPAAAGGSYRLGDVMLGPVQQTADVLTRAHTQDEIRALLDGPPASVDLFAGFMGRP
jgi:uncharacterized protein (TIGR03083 family)